jgi:hypothetical protein
MAWKIVPSLNGTPYADRVKNYITDLLAKNKSLPDAQKLTPEQMITKADDYLAQLKSSSSSGSGGGGGSFGSNIPPYNPASYSI